MIKFEIPGRPIPYTRMTQRSKWVNPQVARYLEYKNAVGWYAKQATKQMIGGSTGVHITIYLTGKRRMDIDNVLKGILDGCNKICFPDDSQIMRISAEKVQAAKAEEQKVVVEIWEIAENESA